MDKPKETTPSPQTSRTFFSTTVSEKKLPVLIFVAGVMLLILLLFSRPGTDALEKRLASALSQLEGAGNVEVVIYQKETESAQTTAVFSVLGGKSSAFVPSGVLVLAQGADELRVRLEIERAVQALLDVPAVRIEVLKKRD